MFYYYDCWTWTYARNYVIRTYSDVRGSDDDDNVNGEAELPNNACVTLAPMTANSDEHKMTAELDKFFSEWLDELQCIKCIITWTSERMINLM